MAATPKPVRKEQAKKGTNRTAWEVATKNAVKSTRETPDAIVVKSKTGSTRPYSKTTTGSNTSVPAKKNKKK